MVISDKSEMLNKYIDLSTPGLLDGKQSLHNFTLSCKTEFLRLIPSKFDLISNLETFGQNMLIKGNST